MIAFFNCCLRSAASDPPIGPAPGWVLPNGPQPVIDRAGGRPTAHSNPLGACAGSAPIDLRAGFGGGGCMLARGFGSNRIAGRILLVVAVAGAAVFYADPYNPRDLIAAAVWLVGRTGDGAYLILFRSETPP